MATADLSHAVRARGPTACTMLGVGVCAYLAGSQSVASPKMGFLVAGAAAAVAGVLYPKAIAVIAIGLLPMTRSVFTTGARVTIADLLMVLTVTGLVLLPSRVNVDVGARLRELRPVVLPVAVYYGALGLVTVDHLSLTAILNAVQRVELTAVPLVIGAAILDRRLLTLALRLYVGYEIAVSLIFIGPLQSSAANILVTHKNPAAQGIANAMLIVLVLPAFARFRPALLAVMGLGLLFSDSRGAMLGFLLAVIVLSLRGRTVARGRIAASLSALLLLAAVSFPFLPTTTQTRVLNPTSPTDGALLQREVYRVQALGAFRSDPILGVGIGNLAGVPGIVSDPHNVLFLDAAEGGVVLGGALLALLSLPMLFLFRRRHGVWTDVAIAVQLSIVIHGLVDVYWVRSTPVTGWLLIGAALAHSNVRDGSAGTHQP